MPNVDLRHITDRIFVNEDISSPENRINLAIFHLQMDKDFHDYFMSKLGLPVDTVMYPVGNVGGGRPDFVLHREGDDIAFVEVELGQEDVQQQKRYGGHLRTFFVTGRRPSQSPLCLEDISTFLSSEIQQVQNSQVKVSAVYLIKLIREALSGANSASKRAPLSDKMLRHPFVVKLLDGLKQRSVPIVYESANLAPGTVLMDTVKEEGFSLRIYSPVSRSNSVSLLFISGGRQKVGFNPGEHYKTYLPHKANVVEDWIRFISRLVGYDINLLTNKKELLPLGKAYENLEKIADFVAGLA
jgi:hypothetical protein